MARALVVVDVQRDFCEGGVLPARDTASLIRPLGATVAACVERGVLCVFTRDWHPPDHFSFVTRGGPWPVHCVHGTPGADFAEGLEVPLHKLVVNIEKSRSHPNTTYSAFERTGLDARLRHHSVEHLGICGIATEYCVRATALDALRLGFTVAVLDDLVRPIAQAPGDARRALDEVERAGARLVPAARWLDLP